MALSSPQSNSSATDNLVQAESAGALVLRSPQNDLENRISPDASERTIQGLENGELDSVERRCWRRAVEIFNSTLTEDDNKRISLTSEDNHPSCNLQAFVESTVAAKEEFEAQRSSFGKKMDSILNTVDEYSLAMDSIMQHAPEIVSIVWGCMRMLTKVATRESEHRDALGATIADLSKRLGQWMKYLLLFEGHQRIERSVSNLLAQLLNYLVRAKSHYQKPLAVRYAKTALTPSKQKFDTILASLRGASEELDREVAIASEIEKIVQKTTMNEERTEQEGFRKESREHYQRQENGLYMQYQNNIMIRSIRENISQMTERIHQEASRKSVEQSFAKVVSWLLKDLGTGSSPPVPEEGTCGWILTHPVFEEWSTRNSPRPLWIYGPPGCGKSALAQHLQNISVASITLTHFFQYSVDQISSLTSSMVASLLLQLLRSRILLQPEILDDCLFKLTPFVECWPCALECPFWRLWPILEETLNALPRYDLIIDALDECTNLSDYSGLLDQLCALGQTERSRVILLSRPHTSLEGLFQQTTYLEMREDVVEKDIMLFTRNKISATVKLQPIGDRIIQKIQKSSQGTFLWARMILDDLSRARSVNDQIQRLDKFPRGLDRVYSRYLAGASLALDDDEVGLRREILMLLVGAMRQLTLEDVSVAIALNSSGGQIDYNHLLLDPQREVIRLCWPLVKIVESQVNLIHMSVKDYLLRDMENSEDQEKAVHLTLNEVNYHLAHVSILKLCQHECLSTQRISLVTRNNAMSNNILTTVEESDSYKDTPLYEYACRNWHTHATSIEIPSTQLLIRIRDFLSSRCFVYWSEALCSFTAQYDMGHQIEVHASLRSWLQLLESELRVHLPLENYCYEAYENLCKQLEIGRIGDDLDILCRFRMGEWLNLFSTKRGEALKLYQSLLNDLVHRSGERDRWTQLARRHCANELIVDGQLILAVEELDSLKEIYLEVVGQQDVEYFTIFSIASSGEFFLTKFDECIFDSKKAADGLRRIQGPMSREAFKCDMYRGYALEALGRADQAVVCFKHVWDVWGGLMGSSNPLSIMAQCSLGAAYRQMQMYDEGAKLLWNNFTARQRIFGLNTDITVDSGLQLALLYRETGQIEQAEALLELISPGALGGKMTERVQQLEHIRALLQFDIGELDSACNRLRKVVRGAEAYTRSLFWILLDLADWLRSSSLEDEALTLFSSVVKPRSSSIPGSWTQGSDIQTPISKDTCIAAESALRLVREANMTEAESILQANSIEWVTRGAFYIGFGGEMANTAWINKPKL